MKQSIFHSRMTGFFLAGIITALDQYTKLWIVNLSQSPQFPIEIFSFFNIALVFNKGISFGMMANKGGWIAIMLPICLFAIVLMLVFWLVQAREKTVIVSLGFIIGGAAGNIIDRIRIGGVVDFLDFHIGTYHWPAFNIADSAIFIGVVIFVFTNIISGKTALKGNSGNE